MSSPKMTRMFCRRPDGAGCACACAVWNGAADAMADAAASVVPAKTTFRRFNAPPLGLTFGFFFTTASTPGGLVVITSSSSLRIVIHELLLFERRPQIRSAGRCRLAIRAFVGALRTAPFVVQVADQVFTRPRDSAPAGITAGRSRLRFTPECAGAS